MDKEFFVFIGVIFVAILSFLYLSVISMHMVAYYVSESNLVKVLDGTKVIYEGRRKCIDIKSSGYNSTLTIYKPTLWCIGIVDKIYVSKDIKVVPVE